LKNLEKGSQGIENGRGRNRLLALALARTREASESTASHEDGYFEGRGERWGDTILRNQGIQ